MAYKFYTARKTDRLDASQLHGRTWATSWHEFCSLTRMNPNQESISPASQSTQSRQGPLRDEPGRGSRAGADEERTLTSEARHVAGELADKATQLGERQLTGGKERAAQVIGQVAEALRHSGQTLSTGTDIPVINEYLGRAASRVDGLSDYLRDKSLTDVVGDVERFARREPVLFMGGAFLVGLLGGRFLRSAQSSSSSGQEGANSRQGARARR